MFSKYAMLWVICVITSQALAHPYHYSTYQGYPIAHRAVIENAASEALYPEHLKNPFYKSPRLREALAHHSWLGQGETPVIGEVRPSERISRNEIYKVLSHAGLIERRQYH